MLPSKIYNQRGITEKTRKESLLRRMVRKQQLVRSGLDVVSGNGVRAWSLVPDGPLTLHRLGLRVDRGIRGKRGGQSGDFKASRGLPIGYAVTIHASVRGIPVEQR